MQTCQGKKPGLKCFVMFNRCTLHTSTLIVASQLLFLCRLSYYSAEIFTGTCAVQPFPAAILYILKDLLHVIVSLTTFWRRRLACT